MPDSPAFKLQPDPVHVSELAHAAVEFRYRLVLNYLRADAEDTECLPPSIVREVFLRLLSATTAINEGRSEDRKTDSHVVAARQLADRFDKEWLSSDHRGRLAELDKGRHIASELTPRDWLRIRREATGMPSDDEVTLSVLGLEAKVLKESPFGDGAWNEYDSKLREYECTFEPACRKVYELMRVLAEVCYPDPASYDKNSNTIPNFDDECLIKKVNVDVRKLIDDIQTSTGLKLKVDTRFDPLNPTGSAERLFHQLKIILHGWSGGVALPPDLARPRWQPSEPGSVIGGILTFRCESGTVPKSATLIRPIFDAFEAASWQSPISLPRNTRPSAINQSLKRWVAGNDVPITFCVEANGLRQICHWRESEERSEVLEKPDVEACIEDDNG